MKAHLEELFSDLQWKPTANSKSSRGRFFGGVLGRVAALSDEDKATLKAANFATEPVHNSGITQLDLFFKWRGDKPTLLKQIRRGLLYGAGDLKRGMGDARYMALAQPILAEFEDVFMSRLTHEHYTEMRDMWRADEYRWMWAYQDKDGAVWVLHKHMTAKLNQHLLTAALEATR